MKSTVKISLDSYIFIDMKDVENVAGARFLGRTLLREYLSEHNEEELDNIRLHITDKVEVLESVYRSNLDLQSQTELELLIYFSDRRNLTLEKELLYADLLVTFPVDFNIVKKQFLHVTTVYDDKTNYLKQIRRAHECLESNMATTAVDILEQLIDSVPKNPLGYLELIDSYVIAEEFDKVLDVVTLGFEYMPGNYYLMSKCFEFLFSSQYFDEASRISHKLLSLDCLSPSLFDNILRAHILGKSFNSYAKFISYFDNLSVEKKKECRKSLASMLYISAKYFVETRNSKFAVSCISSYIRHTDSYERLFDIVDIAYSKDSLSDELVSSLSGVGPYEKLTEYAKAIYKLQNLQDIEALKLLNSLKNAGFERRLLYNKLISLYEKLDRNSEAEKVHLEFRNFLKSS